ncbi:MAG: hypothetical protein WB767_02335, partial [Nocardioides sp.]
SEPGEPVVPPAEPAVIDEIVSRVAHYTSPEVAASLPLDDVEDEFGDIPMSQTARELNDAVVAARAQHEALRRANRAVSAAEARAIVADTVAAEQAEMARAAMDAQREAEARAAESERNAAEAESARAAAEESERRQREMAVEAESAAAETAAMAAEAREEADAALATVSELQERVAELERVTVELSRSRDEAEEEAVVLSLQLAEIAAAATRRTPAAFALPANEPTQTQSETPEGETQEHVEPEDTGDTEGAHDGQAAHMQPDDKHTDGEQPGNEESTDEAEDGPADVDVYDQTQLDEPIHLDADPPVDESIEPPPATEPTPDEVSSGRTLHRPYEYIRRGSAGLIGAMVAIACAAAVAVVALTGQLEDNIAVAVGLTVVALLAALFAYQRLGTASEVRLSADGQLTYVVGGSEHTFDIAGDTTEIEVVGDPGDSDWEVRLVRRGLSPLSIGPRNVDPLEFTRALRQWRPTL